MSLIFPSIGASKEVRGKVSFRDNNNSFSATFPVIAPSKKETLSEDIDCVQWLADIGLDQYVNTFLANLSIDGRIVLRRRMATIRMQDLSKMNIMDYDHQKYLMQHIKLVLKHPFHSLLHRKESSMIESPLKPIPRRKTTEPPLTEAKEGELDLSGLVKQLDEEITKSVKKSGDDKKIEVKDSKTIAKERKKADRRRRSFDTSVWQSISSLRTKEKQSAAAAAQLREGVFSKSPSLDETKNEAAAAKSRGGRRRWSFNNDDGGNLGGGSSKEKGTQYGNLALEFDMLQTNLKALEVEHLSKLCSTLNCERASIFFVNEDTRELLLYADTGVWYRIPPGSGIAGYCAETGQSLNIADAYQDYRFNQNMDRKTGFRTRNILCQPVRRVRGGGTICAVVQLINKRDGLPFGNNDQEVLAASVQRIADLLSDKFKDLQECGKKFSAGAVYVGGKAAAAPGDRPNYHEHTKSSKERQGTPPDK